MTDRIQVDSYDFTRGDSDPFPSLPSWLASKFLHPDETVNWVCGPRLQPSMERWITHPLLFVFALVVAVGCVLVGRLLAGSWAQLSPLVGIPAVGVVLASVFVLGLSNAYFTRLVVTDHQLMILQGYEKCKSWDIDDLPRSLIHYGMGPGNLESRSIDLDAVKTMLGGTSGQFAESKTILAFGKQLDNITLRREDRY